MLRPICKPTARRAIVVASALVAGACRDDSLSTAPPVRADAPQLQQMTQGSDAPDPLLAYARAIPGFGGLFLDNSGMPTIYLTNSQHRARAEQVLAAELHLLGATPSQLRVVKGEYDYLQLSNWLDRATAQVLTIPGAVFVDADEARNRLRIGVANAGADAAVRGVLARLNIPSAAVVLEPAEPFHIMATLDDKAASKRGGLKTNGCTLGFNTYGFLALWFITNSHCTNVPGVVDGTLFYQPSSWVPGSFIGTEITDPAPFTSFPCPSGRKCRWSDAARVLYALGTTVDVGGIARTTGAYSLTIDPANPVFNITAEKASPVMFSVLHKVGQTSGWTWGVVIGTCQAVNQFDKNGNDTGRTMMCQDIVKAKSDFGDSGSPVFERSGSGSNVTLHGILWGGNTSKTQFIFSHMSAIEGELGPMSTY